MRGRSGTGKSTLLSILAGRCEPDRGAVTWGPSFDGCDVTAWDQVAVVPQVLAVMAELSARERRDRASGLRRERGGGDRASDRGARVVTAHRARRPSARRDLARKRQRILLAVVVASPSSSSRTSPRAIRMRPAPEVSWRCYAIEPRSAAAYWSRLTRRCSWMPPIGSSPSTTTDRQVPVSRRGEASVWRKRVGERGALPRDVERRAVVDRGAHDRQPERHVHAALEREQLHGRVTLVVIHADDRVVAAWCTA